MTGAGEPLVGHGVEHGAKPAVKRGVRADFWFGLGLVVFGLAVAVESWRMPRLAELNVHPMTAPGLVPGLLGVVLFGLGGILFLRAARAGGWRFGAAPGLDRADLARLAHHSVEASFLPQGRKVALDREIDAWLGEPAS